MEVIRCGIHGFHEVLGIDVDEIRFFWLLRLDDVDAEQAAYRVVVSTDKNHLSDPGKSSSCWDSGHVPGNTQRDVVCRPEQGFASATMHFWVVTVWDQYGNSAQSSVNEFYTAYPRSSRLLPPYSPNQTYMPHSSLIFRTWFEDEANRWKAVWIGDGGDKPIYLRHKFSIPASPSVRRVLVFTSGLGHFNLSINGSPASSHVLDPGWTDYHRTVQFVAYDATAQFLKGGRYNKAAKAVEHVIGAHVGNGFYAGDQGNRFFWPLYEDKTYVRYGNELCFFAEIHIHYGDGSRETIISDSNWRVHRSATSLANIYASEDHDRRVYPEGWDKPEFDDSTWKCAKPVMGPRGKLRYQSQPPVTLHDTLVPIRRYEPQPGIVVWDLGQNSSIMVRVEASGPRGAEYRVRYSETIGEDGLVLMPDPLFKDFETKVYSHVILAGTGSHEIWTPDFSFTSARYIQIEGATVSEDIGSNDLALIHSVTAQHVSSAARTLGSVVTDKADVNALINACKWTFSSNLFSYHTDCPQIEKFGWLEVTHLLFPATQYVRDIESLHSKILDDIIDSQDMSSGLVPTMAPLMRYMPGPLHDTITWGAAICLLPELLKRYYGSTGTFAKSYEPCVRYMAYMRQKERRGGLIEHGLGDWGRDVAFGNHQANIETAIYYRCLRNVALMARGLGHTEEGDNWDSEAERIYTTYNRHLLVEDRKEYPYAFYTSLDDQAVAYDRTMVAQAVALRFGLVPANLRADVVRALLAAVADSGNVMQAGEIGLEYLWQALGDADVDRPDTVLAMARREEHPSYMRFLRRGDTTLSEFWQDSCRSKCHDMLGTIYEWFYRSALGIEPDGDAYRSWSLRPCWRAEFDFVQGSFESPYGLISVLFDRRGRSDGSARLEIEIPAGTRCTLHHSHDEVRVTVRRQGSGEIHSTVGKKQTLKQGRYVIDITL